MVLHLADITNQFNHSMEKTVVKYLDIYETIKTRILSADPKLSTKLPHGSALAREFNCSELTIKKALDILVKDGLVVRKRGSGSFIKRPLSPNAFQHLNGSKANTEGQGLQLETVVLSYDVEAANEFLSDRLNCQVGDMLHHIIRVRIIDGRPTALEDTYMPINIISGLTMQHIEDSIYEYIRDGLQLKIHSSMFDITVVDANKLELEQLKLKQGDKVVNVEQVVYLDNGDIFEYSNAKHICDTFNFSSHFVKM